MITAEEKYKKFFNSFPRYGVYLADNWKEEIKSIAIEFAKMHIKEALETAARNAQVKQESEYIDSLTGYAIVSRIDEDSILNCYDLDNIK